MLKRISAAVLLLAVASIVFGQPTPAAKQGELQKLQADYNKALQEYYKPYQNVHSSEEAAKIKLDPKKDPSPVYLPKFRKIAEKAGKTEDGFQAWMMVKQISEQAGDNKTGDMATDVIMNKFIDTPWISQFVSMLPYSYWSLAPDQREKKLVDMLTKIESLAKSDDVKASAMYARGKVIGRDGNGDAEAAAKLYREVSEKYPNSPAGKQAKGDIFEMENLVPGKPAPDFEAEDQDGTKFKLSDYKGKVVVLDFWGFW